MDIRLFCYRCFVFLGLWVGYEAQNGNQTTHQRTDDVEEAEGKIDQGRDAKNCTLRHTAIYLGMGIAGGDDTYTVLHTYIVLQVGPWGCPHFPLQEPCMRLSPHTARVILLIISRFK